MHYVESGQIASLSCRLPVAARPREPESSIFLGSRWALAEQDAVPKDSIIESSCRRTCPRFWVRGFSHVCSCVIAELPVSWWGGLISRKVHGISRSPMLTGTEHLSEGNDRSDYLCPACAFHAFDTAPARVDVADGRTHVLFRGGDFDNHYRL